MAGIDRATMFTNSVRTSIRLVDVFVVVPIALGRPIPVGNFPEEFLEIWNLPEFPSIHLAGCLWAAGTFGLGCLVCL